MEINNNYTNKSYDASLISETTVLIVGIGGAFGLLELLAKTGVIKFIIIDYDFVEEKNLLTQGFCYKDVGKPKVVAAKEHLLKINKRIKCKIYQNDFNKLSNKTTTEIYQKSDFVFYMTDDFFTQAKGNLLSIKFIKPSIWAGIFYKGKGAEIVYTIPGITPYCLRCQTASRYIAYKDGYINTITSEGSNIFHNSIINSYVGLLFLAIVNRNSECYEVSHFFEPITTENYIALKMHPEFNKNSNLFNVDNKNLKKKSHHCPDCRDMGDLKKSSELITDTNVKL